MEDTYYFEGLGIYVEKHPEDEVIEHRAEKISDVRKLAIDLTDRALKENPSFSSNPEIEEISLAKKLDKIKSMKPKEMNSFQIGIKKQNNYQNYSKNPRNFHYVYESRKDSREENIIKQSRLFEIAAFMKGKSMEPEPILNDVVNGARLDVDIEKVSQYAKYYSNDYLSYFADIAGVVSLVRSEESVNDSIGLLENIVGTAGSTNNSQKIQTIKELLL